MGVLLRTKCPSPPIPFSKSFQRFDAERKRIEYIEKGKIFLTFHSTLGLEGKRQKRKTFVFIIL
jgi:hypothetical protein